MAANYWTSTQFRCWQFSREELRIKRKELEMQCPQLYHRFPLPEPRLLSLFFSQQLQKLGKKLPSIRQQALATAQVYVKRFLIKIDIRDINLYLLLATALYLACKMEECPQHIRTIVHESRQLWPGLLGSIDVAKLGEYEFFLISEMRSQMIIHHPYRNLSALSETLRLAPSDVAMAWSIINDHYLTDLPLVVAPYVVAVTAIFLTLTLKHDKETLPIAEGQPFATKVESAPVLNGALSSEDFGQSERAQLRHLVNWLADGQVDMKEVIECSQEFISLYHTLEHFSETTCKDQVQRFIKARGLDK